MIGPLRLLAPIIAATLLLLTPVVQAAGQDSSLSSAHNERPAVSSPTFARDLIVVTKTRGKEELKASLLDGQLTIRLKNNHSQAITALAVNFGGTTIREDFAYSDIQFGIEPGDTYETSYAVSSSPAGSEPPTLYLLTVLLKDGAKDGDATVAQEIRDDRLGQKIQIRRTLRVLEKERLSQKDPRAIKSDLVAALSTDDDQTRIDLNELQPAAQRDDQLSDDLNNGLRVGRQKMLRRFEVLEQLPVEYREFGFIEFTERANRLFDRL